MQFGNYQFRLSLVPALALLIAVPVMMSLGNWQTGKARQKQAFQDEYDERMTQPAIQIGKDEIDTAKVRYRKVMLKGTFEPTWQILLDNKIVNDQAGYNVVTPLKLEGSEIRVLVNRGWLPLGADRNILPEVNNPPATIEISGTAVLPPDKIYTLEKPGQQQGKWQIVWQNMDMKQYQAAVPFKLPPIIIQMDKESAGGFVRDWPRPDMRIETHKGYAFQWYGMAVALILFYLATSIRKTNMSEKHQNE